jgi:hypothetical protein
MRPISSAEGSPIELTEDDYVAAVRPLGASDERPVDRTQRRPRGLDERALLDELWRISHLGWIPEAVIRRALTLARGGELPADSLHHGLRRLLDRGWVEHRNSDPDHGEHHWRLTDSGRDAT